MSLKSEVQTIREHNEKVIERKWKRIVSILNEDRLFSVNSKIILKDTQNIFSDKKMIKCYTLHLSTYFTSVQSKGSKLVRIILMENWWIFQMMWIDQRV